MQVEEDVWLVDCFPLSMSLTEVETHTLDELATPDPASWPSFLLSTPESSFVMPLSFRFPQYSHRHQSCVFAMSTIFSFLASFFLYASSRHVSDMGFRVMSGPRLWAGKLGS